MIFFKTLYAKQIGRIYFLFWSFIFKLVVYYFKWNDKINIRIENHDTYLASKENEVEFREVNLEETNKISLFSRDTPFYKKRLKLNIQNNCKHAKTPKWQLGKWEVIPWWKECLLLSIIPI